MRRVSGQLSVCAGLQCEYLSSLPPGAGHPVGAGRDPAPCLPRETMELGCGSVLSSEGVWFQMDKVRLSCWPCLLLRAAGVPSLSPLER